MSILGAMLFLVAVALAIHFYWECSERGEQIADLTEVLEFYADPYNYNADAFDRTSVGMDHGREARNVLKKIEENPQ